MLELHKKLAALLSDAEKLAVEIENGGGNVQGVIHQVRGAAMLVSLRIDAYEDHAAEVAAAKKAAAKPEAKPKTESGNTAAKNLGALS